MSEIYWITRLDCINIWLFIFSLVSGILMIVLTILYIVAKSDYDETMMRNVKSVLKPSTITFFICLPITILTPTKDEALLIWGVGSTIDYVTENETIKQLPDKCVNALNTWVESLGSDKEERQQSWQNQQLKVIKNVAKK